MSSYNPSLTSLATQVVKDLLPVTPSLESEPIASPSDQVLHTQAGNERTEATKIETVDGKKKLVLRGPLSEVFYRALNILYAKDSEFSGNYSLETLGVPKERVFVFTVKADSVTPKDTAQFLRLCEGARKESVKVVLLALGEDSERSSEAIVTLAQSLGVPIVRQVSELVTEAEVSTESHMEDETPALQSVRYDTERQQLYFLGPVAHVVLKALGAGDSESKVFRLFITGATETTAQDVAEFSQLVMDSRNIALVVKGSEPSLLTKTLMTIAQTRGLKVYTS